MNIAIKGHKPLGIRAYGSIGHIHGSRLGSGDHIVSQGQTNICTVNAGHRSVFVQTKVDGSCVAIAKIEGQFIPLTRAGYHARTSPHEMHHIFADWVDRHTNSFDQVLNEGERLVGEWLAQAHGTKYNFSSHFVDHEKVPFVAFDIMEGHKRLPYLEFRQKVNPFFYIPSTIMGPKLPQDAMTMLAKHGAEEPEGVIYRVESNKNGRIQVDFLAKWVQPNKIDGKYLSGEPVWNWRPKVD